MPFPSRPSISPAWSAAVVAVAALVLPLKATGCGRTACFTVTASQLVDGACPSIDVARARFIGGCTGSQPSIGSVDGAGSLDGDLCCYPVSPPANSFDSPPSDCFGGGTTDPGTGPGTTTFSGFGGAGTTTECATCAAALTGAPFGSVCDKSVLQALRVCACASKCTSACDPTVCFGDAPDTVCLSCMESNCAAELSTCQQN